METPTLKNSSALFLQFAVVIVGLVTLALMLVEPHFEGRNAQATVFEVYFKDPFLAYVYVGSIPFFWALWQAFRTLGDIKRNGTLSSATVGGLRVIKHCAYTLIGFVAGAIVIVLLFGEGEDRPPGIMMGVLVALAASVIAAAAAMCERSLRNALERGGGE